MGVNMMEKMLDHKGDADHDRLYTRYRLSY